ncbi:uncharacterized protein ISCGN_007816 [Ixodes scapularis]
MLRACLLLALTSSAFAGLLHGDLSHGVGLSGVGLSGDGFSGVGLSGLGYSGLGYGSLGYGHGLGYGHAVGFGNGFGYSGLTGYTVAAPAVSRTVSTYHATPAVATYHATPAVATYHAAPVTTYAAAPAVATYHAAPVATYAAAPVATYAAAPAVTKVTRVTTYQAAPVATVHAAPAVASYQTYHAPAVATVAHAPVVASYQTYHAPAVATVAHAPAVATYQTYHAAPAVASFAHAAPAYGYGVGSLGYGVGHYGYGHGLGSYGLNYGYGLGTYGDYATLLRKKKLEFLLDKTQPVVSSDDVRDFSGVVEDDKVYQVYWAGDARTKGSFYDAKVLYMAAEASRIKRMVKSSFQSDGIALGSCCRRSQRSVDRMASSDGAMITAVAGRGISSADDYKILLPCLPSEAATVNSVFLHCDVTGRPYRIEDFREELQRLQILGDVGSFGAYQMNHVWLVTFHSASTRNRLLAAKELTVKGKRCILIDPKNSETCLKLHWVPYHVPDDTVRRALEPYGKVHEVTRETWRAQGFQGVQSTTRLVRITRKEGVSKESVPHQLRFFGGSALVLVPGRAPLCLRCKKTGHIRKDCRVPRCDDCHRYGHTRENCVKSYAVATAGPLPDENTDLTMDEAEAELAASANASVRTLPAAPRIAEMPTSGTREPSPQVELPSDAPSGEP